MVWRSSCSREWAYIWVHVLYWVLDALSIYQYARPRGTRCWRCHNEQDQLNLLRRSWTRQSWRWVSRAIVNLSWNMQKQLQVKWSNFSFSETKSVCVGQRESPLLLNCIIFWTVRCNRLSGCGPRAQATKDSDCLRRLNSSCGLTGAVSCIRGTFLI